MIWEDPPEAAQSPAPRGAGKHFDIARELMARPREWARVGSYGSRGSAAAMAHLIHKGGLSAYKPGQFEAVSRTVDGEYRVYVRYAPTGEGHE